MNFTIDDSPMASRMTPTQKKVISYLESLSDGKLYTTKKIAELSNVCLATLKNNTLQYPEYFYVRGRLGLWGNKRTIEALKQQDESNG